MKNIDTNINTQDVEINKFEGSIRLFSKEFYIEGYSKVSTSEHIGSIIEGSVYRFNENSHKIVVDSVYEHENNNNLNDAIVYLLNN